MKILLIEPFFSGSHRDWAQGLVRHSAHDIRILSMPGKHWKWRMQGGAIYLARRFRELDFSPDLVLATDMLALGNFLALTRDRLVGVPTAVYFHENQFAYPQSPRSSPAEQVRDQQYAFMNYTSALCADALFFNSDFNRRGFLNGCGALLRRLPDHRELETVQELEERASVLPLGLELAELDAHRPPPSRRNSTPRILWNHRWEYDKNPEEFLQALEVLQARGAEFELVVLGEGDAAAALRAGTLPESRIAHAGYAAGREEYARLLWSTDIIPVTSRHEFFGASVVEAVYCENRPLLPRRLSYPELLPEELLQGCYYGTFEELTELLGSALENIRETGPESRGRPIVERYDWRKLIGVYDSALAAVRFERGGN